MEAILTQFDFRNIYVEIFLKKNKIGEDKGRVHLTK